MKSLRALQGMGLKFTQGNERRISKLFEKGTSVDLTGIWALRNTIGSEERGNSTV